MRIHAFILSVCFAVTVYAQDSADASSAIIRKGTNSIRVNDAQFFTTEEARRIGDQILLWQRCTGGWPKNIDMAEPLTDEQAAKVMADKGRRDDSTTDNGATTMQMLYLARLFHATADVKYRDGFRRGVEYLLDGQYENGGWPQFWPEMRGYQIHITYNDDAMVNTLELLRDMYEGKAPFGGELCDQTIRKRMKKAFDKGIECILATQIREPLRLDADGTVSRAYTGRKHCTLTVWCQQHDRETFLPAKARSYELPSYCTMESARIVRLLMRLPNPDSRVKRAVHAAMAWFDKYKLTGLRLQRTVVDSKRNTSIVEDKNAATPIWARFYDLNNTMPFVCDRDGIPRHSLSDIGEERRNGYSWYGSRPADLYPLYEAWAEKYDPRHKLDIDLHSKGANENGVYTFDSTFLR